MESWNLSLVLLHPSPLSTKAVCCQLSFSFLAAKTGDCAERLFHFHANTVCSRLFLCFAPSHLQCRRDNLALLPVLFDASQECKAYASVALCNCLLFSRIMTGGYLPAANNCHVPVRGGRQLAALHGEGNLLTGGDLARIKTTI